MAGLPELEALEVQVKLYMTVVRLEHVVAAHLFQRAE